MTRSRLSNKLPIILMSVLVAGLLVLPLSFSLIRQIVFLSKQGEMSKLESGSQKLERMVFTVNDYSRLNFTRPEREFAYRGNMYDIHSITRWGDQVVVLVLWDKTESNLLLADEPGESSAWSKMPGSAKLGFMPYFFAEGLLPDFMSPFLSQNSYQDFVSGYIEPFSRICSPPPEPLI